MSSHVFVVSEWLPKANCEEKLWKLLKHIMDATAKESGCIRAHATRQLSHPEASGKSKYTIVLLQEYQNIQAFDAHCQSDYVTEGFRTYLDDEETGLAKEWRVRLFSEE